MVLKDHHQFLEPPRPVCRSRMANGLFFILQSAFSTDPFILLARSIKLRRGGRHLSRREINDHSRGICHRSRPYGRRCLAIIGQQRITFDNRNCQTDRRAPRSNYAVDRLASARRKADCSDRGTAENRIATVLKLVLRVACIAAKPIIVSLIGW